MGEQLLPCRLLVSLLLLSALMNCKNIGHASSNAIMPRDSNAIMPREEVEVINALLYLIPQTIKIYDTQISDSDCGLKLTNSLSCDCNETTCRVTRLDFGYLGMTGEIPKKIGNLTSLRSLDLSGNKLGKDIPSSFEKLFNLSYLYLDDNLLGGPIPTFFGRMKSLQTLSLTDNNFNGTIPPNLSALQSLRRLYLDGNLLSHHIPNELGDITSLVTLDLSDNQLSGKLPRHLGKLSNLQIMYLYDNQLSGKLPYELGNLGNLIDMELQNNNFNGELPSSFEKLINMTYFDVRGNNFNGKVPDFIAHWKRLDSLNLMGNNFEWRFDPQVFQSLTELRYLHLADLTGGPGGPKHFPFPKINASLVYLTLRNCSILDEIPDFIWQNPSLQYLDLSFNNLFGEIPSFVSNNLKDLYLRGNMLNKSSPQWFINLNQSFVDVSENLVTNLTIPPGKISKNWNLFSCCSDKKNMNERWKIENYHCNNEESIYDQLYINCGGKPENITGIDYEADNLEDSGRSTFFLSHKKNWGYSSMGRSLVPDRYYQYIVNKTCDVNMAEAPLYTTARVAPISLKYFGFCLKNGNYSVKLHFAEILWNPKKKPNKEPYNEGMRVFDVEIQGKKVLRNFSIVQAAKGVNKEFTADFNASVNDNRLEIHLYWDGKGSLGYSFPYYGPLISAISVSPAPVKHGRKLSALTITGIVASALLIPALILVFLWKFGWFGGKGLHDEELKGIELLPGAFFNFRQIKAATLNFSSANKLGEGGFGSVYKGVLSNGTTIAVKQLSAKSRQGIREFVNEVGTISALEHPNLVRLLGCCADDNQLLLVYEYMENNSLAHALFGPGELRLRLNWPTRVKICLGIAKGLAFLHEESKLKIVHRDIKPTNILLDRDLNAKISDFGFAKLYDEEMTHVITKIAGTTGYMAPEYAMRGHLTSKADVYSFGVVTLEIVSGKNSASYRPNDENVYLLDLAYVLEEKRNLIELVDPTLGSDYSSVQAITILELAMLCTNPSPTLRPSMSEVVKILEGKSKIASTPVDPNSMHDSAMAKDMADLSQSTQSASTSQEGTSNASSSQAVSKEVEKYYSFS